MTSVTDDLRGSSEQDLVERLGAPAFKSDPYPTYSIIRERPGWRSPSGYRVFARYDDVYDILRQPAVFGQITRPQPSFHVMDPPDHTRLRGLVSRGFTPKSIAAQNAMINDVAESLVDDLSEAGRMEFMSEYAIPFPGQVIARILGVPYENGERWNPWLEAIKASRGVVRYLAFDPVEVEEQAVTARKYGRDTADHLRSIMDQRRGALADDIVSRLITARDGDDALSEDEVLFTLVLLLGAGLHTTTAQLGNILAALLRTPAALAEVQENPELITNVVEEGLRFDGALQAEYRIVLKDTAIGSVPVAAGEKIMMQVGAANHDPSVFSAPDEFDIHRENAKTHLTFGFGIHRCLGAELARVELRAGLRALLTKLRGISLDGEPVNYEFDRFRGLSSLRIAWAT